MRTREPLAVAALVALLSPPPSPAQQPSFPSAVGLVRIDVVVADSHGRPVEGLRASDFELFEDGRPQRIDSFEAVVVRGRPSPASAVDAPRPARLAPKDGAQFVVFYDDLHLTPADTLPAREAIRRFLAEGARPGDRVTVVAPAQGLWWTARLPDGQPDLLALTEKLQGRRLRGNGSLDYQGMLVHQRAEDGMLASQLPGALAGTARQIEKRREDESQLERRLTNDTAGTRIDAPRSRLAGGPADLVGMGDPVQSADLEAEYYDGSRLNRLSLEAMRQTVAALAFVPGRKSLVLVSDGMVDDPELRQYAQVVEAARLSNTVVYFLDVRGLQTPAPFLERELPDAAALQDRLAFDALVRNGAAVGAERLADETGGRTLHGNRLADGLLRVAAEAHGYYLLGYQPADATRHGVRRLEVRVRRPGVEVRSRPGWSASEGSPPAADALDLLARSGTDLADVPLVVSAYAFDETRPGHTRVIVAADLDLPPADEGTEVSYRVLVLRRGEADALVQAGRERLEPLPEPPWKGGFFTHAPLAHAFELAPGRYQVRLAVALPDGTRGAATRAFDVPEASGLRLSTPILTDRIVGNGEHAPRAVVHGLKAFWPNATLFCQYEVYGVGGGAGRAPAVEGGYTLRAEDGRVVRSAPASLIGASEDGRVLRTVGFPLAGLPPGLYTVTVDVRDTVAGTTASAVDGFRLQAIRR
ncbi:MAG TPA: VWA domain-containing protein [Vicinamibacteria bacterium]|nr:VWA domain-containing protein [Vicinamibacteria bacterium]